MFLPTAGNDLRNVWGICELRRRSFLKFLGLSTVASPILADMLVGKPIEAKKSSAFVLSSKAGVVGKIRKIRYQQEAPDLLDVTSAGSSYPKYMKTFNDPGWIEAYLFHTKETLARVGEDLESNNPIEYQLDLGETQLTFLAFITDCAIEGWETGDGTPPDSRIDITMRLV